MRTTLTLDDDVAALVDAERHRTGETLRQAINRLLRRSAQRQTAVTPDLPILAGRPRVDITDVSATLADDEDDSELSKHLA